MLLYKKLLFMTFGTALVCSENFILPFIRYVEKYCRAEDATDDNMAHAQSMLDN